MLQMFRGTLNSKTSIASAINPDRLYISGSIERDAGVSTAFKDLSVPYPLQEP